MGRLTECCMHDQMQGAAPIASCHWKWRLKGSFYVQYRDSMFRISYWSEPDFVLIRAASARRAAHAPLGACDATQVTSVKRGEVEIRDSKVATYFIPTANMDLIFKILNKGAAKVERCNPYILLKVRIRGSYA